MRLKSGLLNAYLNLLLNGGGIEGGTLEFYEGLACIVLAFPTT